MGGTSNVGAKNERAVNISQQSQFLMRLSASSVKPKSDPVSAAIASAKQVTANLQSSQPSTQTAPAQKQTVKPAAAKIDTSKPLFPVPVEGQTRAGWTINKGPSLEQARGTVVKDFDNIHQGYLGLHQQVRNYIQNSQAFNLKPDQKAELVSKYRGLVSDMSSLVDQKETIKDAPKSKNEGETQKQIGQINTYEGTRQKLLGKMADLEVTLNAYGLTDSSSNVTTAGARTSPRAPVVVAANLASQSTPTSPAVTPNNGSATQKLTIEEQLRAEGFNIPNPNASTQVANTSQRVSSQSSDTAQATPKADGKQPETIASKPLFGPDTAMRVGPMWNSSNNPFFGGKVQTLDERVDIATKDYTQIASQHMVMKTVLNRALNGKFITDYVDPKSNKQVNNASNLSASSKLSASEYESLGLAYQDLLVAKNRGDDSAALAAIEKYEQARSNVLQAQAKLQEGLNNYKAFSAMRKVNNGLFIEGADQYLSENAGEVKPS